MPWQVPITVDGLEYPVTFNTENEPTQQDYDEAIQQILQQRGQTIPQQPTGETPGYLSQLGTALGLGYRQMASGVGATFNALTGDTADVAAEMVEMGKLQREQQAAQTPEDVEFMRRLEEAKKAGEEAQGPIEYIGALAQYPAAALAEPGAAFKTAVQSAPNVLISAGTQLAGRALGGLVGGAGGLELGPGAILTGIAGSIAGGALSNTLMEAGPSIYDVLNERTQGAAANMTADQIATYLKDNPDIIDEGLKTGAIRGTVIGAVESLGMKGSGKLMTMPERAAARAVQKKLVDAGVDIASKEAVDKALLDPALRTATRTAAEAAKKQFSSAGNLARLAGGSAIETGAAVGGELAAQAAAGQEIDTTEAFLEGLGEMALSVPISAANKTIEGAKYMLNPALQNPDTQLSAQAAQEEINKAKAEAARLAAEKAAEAARIAEEQRKAAANAIPKANIPPPPSPVITPESTVEELQAELTFRENARKTLDFGDQGNAQIDNDIQTLTQEIQSRSAKPPVVTPPPAAEEQTGSVPLMVTRDMTQQLVDLGYSKTDINSMRPEEAVAIIKSGVSKKTISPEMGMPPETPPPVAEVPPPAPAPRAATRPGEPPRVVNAPLDPADKQVEAPILAKDGFVLFARPDGTRYKLRDNSKTPPEWQNALGKQVMLKGFGTKIGNPFTLKEPYTDEYHRLKDVPVGDTVYSVYEESSGRTIGNKSATELFQEGWTFVEADKSAETTGAPQTLSATEQIPASAATPVAAETPTPTIPTQDATSKRNIPENIREEPQDGAEGGATEKTSLGDRILGSEKGKVEEEVDLKAGLPRQQPGEAPDIITWLKENYARKPIVFVPKAKRRKATAEAEALGILDELPLPVKRRLFSFDYGEGTNVANMDEIAGLAYKANLIPSSDPTVLAQSIIEAFKARKAGTSLIKEGEQQMETAEQRTIEFYKAASDRTAPLTLIPSRDLDIGDVVQVGEDKMRVTYEYDEDGYLTTLILTGPKFGEQRFDPNKPLKAENTSNASDLKAVNNNTASQDQIDALVNRGFVEIYKGSPVITDVGVEQMPKKPKLTADQRKAQIDAEQAAPAERAAKVEGVTAPVAEPIVAEKPSPAPLREGAGVTGVAQTEPPRGSIPEVKKVSPETETLSTPQSLAQNKEDAKQQKKDSDENLKALNSLEAGTKTNPVFGTVTREDASEAMRLIEDGKELPNVFFTVVTTREEFLADPRNEQLYPQVWNALKTNKKIEGLFDDATNTPFVFTDGVVIYDLDRKAAQELGISPQVAAVRRVLRHENIHKGMLHLTPSEMVAMRRFLATIFSEEALDNLAKTYTKYANWRSDPRLYFQAIEEIVNQKLDQSTVLPKDGIWGQFFELLTAIWRRITGKRNQPTVKDMKDVMRLVRNGLIRSAKAQADQTKDGGNVMLSYVGEKAIENLPEERRQFMRDSLDAAKAMAAAGKDSEEIRAVTGWFPGKYDGKMRWEVPDDGAKMTRRLPKIGSKLRLDEVIRHPALFEAYPTLAGIEVWGDLMKSGAVASFSPSGSYIKLDPRHQDFMFGGGLSNILHEVQHAIQKEEGFARGGSILEFSEEKKLLDENKRKRSEVSDARQLQKTASFAYNGDIDAAASFLAGDPYKMKITSAAKKLAKTKNRAELDAMESELLKKQFDLQKQSPEQRYVKLAGEIEARDVESRIKMTEEERRKTAPFSKENIAPEDAIVMFGGGGAQMSMATPEMDAEYLAAVEQGDSGNDNLNQLLRDASPNERQAVVDSWIKRNPNAAARMQRMVDEAARAAGFINNADRFESKEVGVVDDGVIEKKISLNGAQISFEESDKVVWILSIDTPEQKRGTGLAKRLIWEAFSRNKGKKIEHGEYTDEGRKYLYRYNSLSADPVTYDDNGNVIPLEQRFQPTSPDPRFSLPIVHSSESEASYANGQMAASMVTFTPRQMDVYSALEGAYNMSRKPGRHSVPLSELYQAALEALPDMTQQEFSEAVQTMYQNNSALLNAGESDFSVVNKDGDRVSSVVFLGKGPMASMIPSSEVPEIASKLASDLKASVTEGEQTPYEGLSFTGVTPKTHARVDYRGVRKSAEDFVNQMIRAQKAKGKSYADALIEVANTITNPSFANEYMADSGTEEKLLATQAVAGPLNAKIYSALLTTKDDVTRIKLNDAYTNVSTYYEGSGTIGGTVMGYRAWESTNGKYGWMLDSWKADALKNAEDAINSQMGGSVSIQIGESLRRSVEGVSDSTANEVESQAQEDRDAALFREGQEALTGENKNIFESIKSFLKTKAIINRRKLIRAGNQAMASIVSDEEYNAIMAMSDEEANALEKEIDAKLSAALKKLNSSLSGREDVKAKVDAAINVATDRANKGEDITFTQVTIEEAMADLFKTGDDTREKIVDNVADALLKRAKQAMAKPSKISSIQQLIASIKRTLLANIKVDKTTDADSLGRMLAMTFAQQVSEARVYASSWSEGRKKVREMLAEIGIEESELDSELNKIMPPTPTLAFSPSAAKRAIALAMEESGVSRENLLDPRPEISKQAKDKLMAHLDKAAANENLTEQGWNKTGNTGRQLAEKAIDEAIAKWRIEQQNRLEISNLVAEQADNPVSMDDFAKKLSKFNLTPKQVKKYFDIAARAAVRSVEMRKDQARRIIYTRGDIRPDAIEKEVDGDTVIDAFTDQVSSPTDLKTFVERLDKLGVTFDLAESLFNTAARERRDRQRTRVFDMIEGPRALQKMLDEIRNVRAGLEVPLRSPIPWKELLSKPAKSVAEYRQKVLDAIMANPDLASVDSEVKERLADMFADVWQQQLDKVVNQIIDNYTQQLDRAKRRHAGDVLNKTRLQVIQHLNLNALSNDAFTRILGEKFGIKMELTEAERENIQRLVDIQQDETLPKNKRNQAANDLAFALVNDTKVGWSERLSAFWTSSVLAGWNTMIAIGLAFLNGANIIMVNLPMKIMSNLINGDFKGAFYSTFDSLNDIKRYIEAFPEALERSWHYLNTGRVEFLESEASAPDRIFRGWADVLRYRKVAEAMANDPKKVTQWMGKFSVMISRMMTALDGFNTILTKRGKLSMAVRLTAKSPEDHQRILEKASLEHYRQQILASDPYFAQMNSEKRALLNATAEAMMYEAMNKEGAKLENADFFASESAMTMNPTGIGGIVYNKIRSADVEVQEFMRRKLAEQKLKAAVAGPMSLENAKLAGMFVAHFIAYNAINMIGLRFARFASNKFNQGLSFIPFVGILRGWEASNNQLADRKEAFYDMIKRNQMVGMFFVGAGSILLRAIADEPDDEERGFFINGGLKNVPTDKRRQLQESGKLEYRLGAKIGGKWYIWNYQNSPYSQLFAAVGAISDIIRFSPDKWNEKSKLDVALSVAASGLSSTLDLPALQGLGTLMGRSVSSSDPTEQFWENIGATTANWVGGFIPKPFMDVDYILDDNRRKYTTIWEKFAGKVPFYRRYVGEDYYNILGDPIKANTLPGSREFLVGKTEPVYQILGALNSRNIWLTPANAEYRMVGKGRNRRRLTQEEADAYSFETGKGYKAMILRYGPRALQMDPERAKAFLHDKADQIRDRALKKVYRGYRSRTATP